MSVDLATINAVQTELDANNAIMVSHYYVDEAIQYITQKTNGFVGDSLEMARFGAQHEAKTLMVSGVRFMGETAKILSPEKTVLMPTLSATCSLDEGCQPTAFSEWIADHPNRTVVVYANTSAAVKAQADWVVTSSIGLDVVRMLHQRGEKILWAPDRHLGAYIQKQTQADMLLWDGQCIVHDEFKADALMTLRQQYPDAAVLVHPESPMPVINQADVVGSTKQLLQAVIERTESTFIVATDRGLFYAMQSAVPDKKIIVAPTLGVGGTCRACASCPWMQMNSVPEIITALQNQVPQIQLPKQLIEAAKKPLDRMLAFRQAEHVGVAA